MQGSIVCLLFFATINNFSGKVYKNVEEELHRFSIFENNVMRIEEHNRLFHLGKTSYYMGLNQFTDKTGSLEGQHFRKIKKLISLSEEQVVDCSGSFGNKGCSCGRMGNAFNYIKAVGGIESEKEYPYIAKEQRCHFIKSEVVATDTGYVSMESGDEETLQKAVAEIGPISVTIDASHSSMFYYAGGV